MKKRFIEGNIAVVEGAVAAGARFYAGYPISPSSEIAEYSSMLLPKVGGMYIQMEDELSSMAALLGASAAGKKAYTATSGPGISLMQENLGLGIMSEIPCVVIDVQRSGPSTGAATKPAQGDMMQCRWGCHGDHSIIALSPASAQECFDLTVQAFNLAERYRTPVYLMMDEVIGHLRETVVIRELSDDEIVNRRQPDQDASDFRPYGYDGDVPCPMPPFGSPRYLSRTTGSTHDEKGEFCPTPENIHRVTHYLTNKIEAHRDDICMTKEYLLEDAQVALIAYGCTVRSALSAVEQLREQGVPAGLLQLQTVWPLPEQELRRVLDRVHTAVVVELNLGQIAGEIRKLSRRGCQILQANRVDGVLITPKQIMDVLREGR